MKIYYEDSTKFAISDITYEDLFGFYMGAIASGNDISDWLYHALRNSLDEDTVQKQHGCTRDEYLRWLEENHEAE